MKEETREEHRHDRPINLIAVTTYINACFISYDENG